MNEVTLINAEVLTVAADEVLILKISGAEKYESYSQWAVPLVELLTEILGKDRFVILNESGGASIEMAKAKK